MRSDLTFDVRAGGKDFSCEIMIGEYGQFESGLILSPANRADLLSVAVTVPGPWISRIAARRAIEQKIHDLAHPQLR